MNTLVLEDSEAGEIAVDVYQKLASNRVLFIHESVNDKVATDICASLMLKDSENSEEKISIFLNCEEGDLRSIFMIYDVMNMISSPIETVCIGSAWGESLLLLAAGTPGMRYASPNSIICGSQVSHDRMVFSDMTDIKIAKEIVANDNRKFLEALGKTCKKTYKQISKDFEIKKFMSPTQAKKYGLIDGIIKFKK